METALALEDAGPWGQGFAEPLFEGRFTVISMRVLSDQHRKFELRSADGVTMEAIWFNSAELPVPTANDCWIYRLGIDRYRAAPKPMIYVQGVHPPGGI